MKRIGYSALAYAALVMIGLVGTAFASPVPNSAALSLRIFDDCPLSILTPVNTYPALISIDDVMNPACVGFANLHSWSYSEDGGATPSLFVNQSNFRACATFLIDGPGTGEGGLRFGPWWSPLADGRFMANATTGEIAVFAGRLPFYSFTVNHGINYVKGTPIYMEMTYLSHSLTQADPATIQYRVTYNAVTYDSPVLNYDEGNPNENPPHGLWGCLHDAMVGGYFQPRANTGVGLTATWRDICFENLDVVPVQNSTWGRMKVLYR